MAERLRIGLVTPGFSASDDDWCIPALHDLVRALACHHEVYVLALRYPYHPGTYQACGATVEALAAAGCRGVARIPMLWRAVAALRREARGRRLQVLHGLWAHEPGLVVTAAGRALGVPTVVSILGGELAGLADIGYGGQLSTVNRWLTRWSLAQGSAVTVGSHSLQRAAAPHVPSGRLHLLPLGVDAVRFAPDASGEEVVLAGRPAILHVASLSAVKDQATLLEAFALARRDLPDAHLHVIGEGEARTALGTLIGTLGLEAHVTFHGAIPHHHLPPYYRAADVCVLSSRFESQCMVVLEAAACGRQTIGTRVGVLAEVAGDEATVEPGDAQALAALMVSSLDRDVALPLRPAIPRDRLVAAYGLDATVSRLCDLYRSLTA